MNFVIKKGSKYNFSPIYSIKEQSFSTEPDAPGDFSIMIKGGYTSLDVSLLSSTLYCISGFNPQKTWKKANLVYPEANDGSVKVIFDCIVQPGMGIDYVTDWKTFYDKNTGVICICGSNIPCNATNIEFTNNTIASIYDGKLVAVWLKPLFVK